MKKRCGKADNSSLIKTTSTLSPTRTQQLQPTIRSAGRNETRRLAAICTYGYRSTKHIIQYETIAVSENSGSAVNGSILRYVASILGRKHWNCFEQLLIIPYDMKQPRIAVADW